MTITITLYHAVTGAVTRVVEAPVDEKGRIDWGKWKSSDCATAKAYERQLMDEYFHG